MFDPSDKKTISGFICCTYYLGAKLRFNLRGT